MGYVSDLDLARKTPRVGENPLLIRAIGRQGSFGAHAVVTNEDAEWILRENKETAFLEKFRVVFVLDPRK
ncbi:MAG: hypothetical protein COZ05_11640 [Armatimonadetes bacterium CG_4_10_14_3_um_filter_59_10]|nr:MAG: hypothetical protein COZ05_11640 [Armatimonadetes bacterium CG_4_10_14_3_um_filter_59_10]